MCGAGSDSKGGHSDPTSSAAPLRPPPPKRKAAKIVLNVYNLVHPENNTRFDWFGVGIFHCGVEIYGKEWSYGGYHQPQPELPDVCGIFSIPPRTAMPPQLFHKALELGETALTEEQVRWIIDCQRHAWSAKTYNILGRNCNHFCEEFVRKLGEASRCEYTFPSWVNRAARVSDMFVPQSLLDYILKQLPQPPSATGAAAGGCSSGGEEDAEQQHVIPPSEELPALSTRQLKTIMFVHRIDFSGCVEKQELIQRIEAFRTARDEAGASS